MAGIEGNFFRKKMLPPEVLQQMQANGKNQNVENLNNVNGVEGVQGAQGTRGVQELEPYGQPKEDKQAETKKQEVARVAEDAMQELQIEEPQDKSSFFDDIKKKMFS